MLGIIALTVMSVLLGSCRTTRGFGRDLQHLGSKIEHEAAKHE